jgi:hypothetical protein
MGSLNQTEIADLLQAFLWSRFSQERVPSPTHPHNEIELAAASSSVRFGLKVSAVFLVWAAC